MKKTSKPKETECPVCNGNPYDVDKSGKICARHSCWFVTRCQVCKQYAISRYKSICNRCLAQEDKIHLPNNPFDDYGGNVPGKE